MEGFGAALGCVQAQGKSRAGPRMTQQTLARFDDQNRSKHALAISHQVTLFILIPRMLVAHDTGGEPVIRLRLFRDGFYGCDQACSNAQTADGRPSQTSSGVPLLTVTLCPHFRLTDNLWLTTVLRGAKDAAVSKGLVERSCHHMLQNTAIICVKSHG